MKGAINRNRFDDKVIGATFDSIRFLSVGKGGEYAGDADVLAHFKRTGEAMGLSPELVLGVFMSKHLAAIDTYIRRAGTELKAPPAEPIEGRIDDAIMYLLLLKAMIVERSEKGV